MTFRRFILFLLLLPVPALAQGSMARFVDAGGRLTIPSNLTNTGTFGCSGALSAGGNVTAHNGFSFVNCTRGSFKYGSDGILTLLNNAGNNFTTINLGSSTAAFPAIGRTNGDVL